MATICASHPRISTESRLSTVGSRSFGIVPFRIQCPRPKSSARTHSLMFASASERLMTAHPRHGESDRRGLESRNARWTELAPLQRRWLRRAERRFAVRRQARNRCAWPLLTGERAAHYELAAGRRDEAVRLLSAIETFASDSGMIPEQVWDVDDIPERGLYFGRPSGSAMPLGWAHAEYLKLRRSIRDGRVFDMPPHTVARYVVQKTRSRCEFCATIIAAARSLGARPCGSSRSSRAGPLENRP